MVFGVETGREVGRRGQIRIGFIEEKCFRWFHKLHEIYEAFRNEIFIAHLYTTGSGYMLYYVS